MANHKLDFFWRIHNQEELDLLILRQSKRIGFEVKYKNSPKSSHSMKIAMQDLKPDELNIIYPGTKDYRLNEKIKVLHLSNYLNRH